MVKKRTYNLSKEWRIVLDDNFSRESDRAAVIISASLLDNALYTLLRTHLVAITSSSDEVFDGPNAPLHSFSAKIIMTHRLGLISASFTRDLHLIRKIRNDFAHNLSGTGFNDTAIKSRVEELIKSTCLIEKFPKLRRTFPKKIRGNFQMIVDYMLYHIYYLIEHNKSLTEADKEPAYLDDFCEEDSKKD